MKILVCIRSAPDGASTFRVGDSGAGYEQEGLVFQVNEYDMFAIEEAVRIKERRPDVEITVVSVGPPRVEAQARKAMGLGADRGVVIDNSGAAFDDAMATASLIAAWSAAYGFDLVLCGVMSEDLRRGQTGPMLAELLGFPCATTAVRMDLADDLGKVVCERELEGGAREVVELLLPAVVTVQSGINVPRYGSLSNVLRVKRLEVPVIPAESLGRARTGVSSVRVCLSDAKVACEFIEGDVESAAEELIARIRSVAPVI